MSAVASGVDEILRNHCGLLRHRLLPLAMWGTKRQGPYQVVILMPLLVPPRINGVKDLLRTL